MLEYKIKIDNRKLLEQATEQQIHEALDVVGTVAQEDVAQRAPVDTGRLKNSISHKVGENYVDIFSDVEYAPYQEYGTSKISAKHFMKNGIEVNLDKYKDIIENVLRQ